MPFMITLLPRNQYKRVEVGCSRGATHTAHGEQVKICASQGKLKKSTYRTHSKGRQPRQECTIGVKHTWAQLRESRLVSSGWGTFRACS